MIDPRLVIAVILLSLFPAFAAPPRVSIDDGLLTLDLERARFAEVKQALEQGAGIVVRTADPPSEVLITLRIERMPLARAMAILLRQVRLDGRGIAEIPGPPRRWVVFATRSSSSPPGPSGSPPGGEQSVSTEDAPEIPTIAGPVDLSDALPEAPPPEDGPEPAPLAIPSWADDFPEGEPDTEAEEVPGPAPQIIPGNEDLVPPPTGTPAR